MVNGTLRKHRSKRHIKRSSKRYRRHAKTRMRIRRNMYRTKHKKTQRGGLNLQTFTSGLQLPPGWKLILPEEGYGPIYGRTIYQDPGGNYHYDHPNTNANNVEIALRLRLIADGKNPNLGDLNTYTYSNLTDLHYGLREECNKDLETISQRMRRMMPTPSEQQKFYASFI